MTEIKRRTRSVVLDAAKVRQLAYDKLKIATFVAFEEAFLSHIGDSNPNTCNSTPSNAWNGKTLDKNRAINIGIFLGLTGYAELLPIVESGHDRELRGWPLFGLSWHHKKWIVPLLAGLMVVASLVYL